MTKSVPRKSGHVSKKLGVTKNTPPTQVTCPPPRCVPAPVSTLVSPEDNTYYQACTRRVPLPLVSNPEVSMICDSNVSTVPIISITNESEVMDYEVDDDSVISTFEDPSFELSFDNISVPNENSEAYALASKIFSDRFLNLDEELVVGDTVEVARGVGIVDEGFAEVDEEDLKEINEGGANHSIGVERWFTRCFHKWQIAKKFHEEVEPEELPLPTLAEGLVPFLLGVRKLNGEFYPSGILSQLFRACSRMVRRRQIKRVCESRQDEVPMFLQTHAFFEKSRLALIKAMDRSIKAGANKKRKKSQPLRWHDEKACLEDQDMSINHASGVQKRWYYYCLSRFMIRGYSELWKLLDIDFTTDEDEYGKFVMYSERDSKNYKTSMTCFQQEHFRDSVTCHEPDVVATYMQLMRHMPPKVDSTVGRHIFLQAIRGNPRTNVWFNTNNVGIKVLTAWTRNIMALINSLGFYTNKSPRYTTIQRMIQAGVPTQVGMAIIGHRSEASYRRYNQSIDLQKMAAMEIIVEPFKDGKRVMYEDIFKEVSQNSVRRELAGNSVVTLLATDQNTSMGDVMELEPMSGVQVIPPSGAPQCSQSIENIPSIAPTISNVAIGMARSVGNVLSTVTMAPGSPIPHGYMIQDDVADIAEFDKVMLREWPEGAKHLGYNVVNSQFTTTNLGTSISNCTGCTFNITVDANSLKDFLKN